MPEFERLVRQHGKLRLLFDVTGFHGWEASAAWEDFKFGIEHFADIERLAMVGEKQWQRGSGWTGPLCEGREHHYNDFETHDICCIAKSWDSQLEMVRRYNVYQ